jgi:hypothetical protein
MRVLFGLVVALAAFPASAQIVTNCNTWGSNTKCTTEQRPTLAMPDYAGDAMRAYQQGQALRAERLRQEALQQQAMQAATMRADAEAEATRRRMGFERMGALVTAGRCKEATELAFAMGAPEMVSAVAASCKPSLDGVGAALRAAQAGTPANLTLPEYPK